MPEARQDDENVQRIRDALHAMAGGRVAEANLGDETVQRIRASLPASGTLVVYLQVVGKDNVLQAAASKVEQSFANERRLVFSRLAEGASIPVESPGAVYSEAISASGEPSPPPQLQVQLTGGPSGYDSFGSWVATPGVIHGLWHITTH